MIPPHLQERLHRVSDGDPTAVLRASPEWSAAHLEDEPATVVSALLDALGAYGHIPDPTHATAHRWRYSRVTRPLGTGCLWDARGLGVCGDGLLGGRVEDALLSGAAMAGRVLGSLVGLLTIWLAVWLQRRDERRSVRVLGWIALAAVIGQSFGPWTALV